MARTSVTVSTDLLQVIRRVKCFLTLGFDERVTNEDAVSFLIAERVLGAGTVFGLVRGINDIRESNGEKRDWSAAVRRIASLIREEPAAREERIGDLREGYRELVGGPGGASNGEKRSERREKQRFLGGLSGLEGLPENPLVEEYRSNLNVKKNFGSG